MNRLDIETRARILSCLVEGNGVRPTARIVGVAINTVQGLIRTLGPVCHLFHDEYVRGLSCQTVQCDEAWAFNYCRQKNVKRAKAAPPEAGDAWVWSAICATTKAVVGYAVGPRNATTARSFMKDVAGRIDGAWELNTDGLNAYRAGAMMLPDWVSYAQIVKNYATPSGTWNDRENRYQAPALVSVTRKRIFGEPDTDRASTSFSERLNLGLRMQGSKMRRLSNTHAKRAEMLRFGLDIYYAYYNWARPHATLGGRTPAMAQGLIDRRLTMAELASLADGQPPMVAAAN